MRNGIVNRNVLLAALGVLVCLGVAAWVGWRAAGEAPRLVYTPEGYGGPVPPAQAATPALRAPDGPLAPALAAYNDGRYREAKRLAQPLVGGAKRAGSGKARKADRADGLRARWVLAFSAARRNDLPLARKRYAQLREEAAAVGMSGRVDERTSGRAEEIGPNRPFVHSSTRPLISNTGTDLDAARELEEEAAYQHAVLTGALGDRKAAEAEYLDFMRRYPESPLVHAAVRRIARFHGGDLPRQAEQVRRKAMAEALRREQARQRERSLCGPECLAQLLRRNVNRAAHFVGARAKSAKKALKEGEPGLPGIEGLAREMGTDYQGTTLAALARVAKLHGFKARGLELTWKGLRGQRLPLIALIEPGHFVLVDGVTEDSVLVWDPDTRGRARPGARRCTAAEWQRAWNGIVLVLR